MEELIKVLEKTVSSLQSDQNEAVRFIQDYITRDFTGFLKALSDVLYDQQNAPVVRAAAGLQLKNQLTARDEALRQQQQDRWRSLPEDTRNYIKERVFRSLGTEVMKPTSAGRCLAYIAVLELPYGQWPRLIQALTENIKMQAPTPDLKLASLEAIGYICRDIDQSCLQPEDSDSILNAIVMQGMGPNECDAVQLAATTALLNFSESKVQKISKSCQTITFEELGKQLNVEPQYAERIIAQMMREERIKGHINQIDGVVSFDSKNVLQLFDQEILKLCSDVNGVIEKIRSVVPEEWWIANAHQT